MNRSVESAATPPAPRAGGGSPRQGPGPYLAGRLDRWQRALVGLVAIALLPVMFVPILPVWRIVMIAPQYREGLVMRIYVNDVRGDLRNINILNHYIGMKQIDPANFPEFGYMPWAVSLFGLAALAAAIAGRRWPAWLGWAGFATFGTLMMFRFAEWMQDYGTNLDPKAALDFGAFTPPLLGTAVRGNFVIRSFPHVGGYILLLAGLLGPGLLLVEILLKRRRRAGVVVALALALGTAARAGADEFLVYAEPAAVSPLQELVDTALPGDTLRLPEGVHSGQLRVDKTLVLIGPSAAVLDGAGRASVLIIQAPGVVLRGFTVRNSGYELLFDDAGILVDEADDLSAEGLRLDDNNHGIYVRNALRPVIRNCNIVGRRGRVHEENHGNGVHIWHSRDARVEENRISRHRDGIYLSFAESATVRGNVFFTQDRFGLHSMYSQRNVLTGNAFTRNTAGVALMFSNRMEMVGNLFIHNRGHRTYGLLLRDCSDSLFRHNRLVDNTIALFLDGSNRNTFTENLIAENGWGVIAYSSSEGNVFTGNSFLSNDYQMSLDMRRTRNRLSDGTDGNYWSDNRPYDLDGDGRGDAPFQPIGLFAFVSKQFPDLTVFAQSPAVLALDIAQRSLPALQLTELVDPHPLLAPRTIPSYDGPPLPGFEEEGGVPRLMLGLVSLLLTSCGTLLIRRPQ